MRTLQKPASLLIALSIAACNSSLFTTQIPTSLPIPSATATFIPTSTQTPIPPTITPIPTATQLWSSPEFSWNHIRLNEQGEAGELYMSTSVFRCLKITLKYDKDGLEKTATYDKLCGSLYVDPNDTNFLKRLNDILYRVRQDVEEYSDLPIFTTAQLQNSLVQAENITAIVPQIEDYYDDTPGAAYLATANEQYAKQMYACCSDGINFEARTFYIKDKRYYVLERFNTSPGGYYGYNFHTLFLGMSADPADEKAKELYFVFEYSDKFWVAVVPVHLTFNRFTLEEIYDLRDGEMVYKPGTTEPYPVRVMLYGKR